MMKPVICVPMGDAAGIGPEIVVAAILDPAVAASARVLVVGHGEILRRAAAVKRISLRINRVGDDLAGLEDGALNLLHMDNISASSFAYGRVQASCGQAALEYIAKGVDLAMAGKVDALATAPINKEALKAARVPYIGHTEILADLANSGDLLTMFQTRELRIFFLTRHLPLMEACKAVSCDRVIRYIRRCSAALGYLGIRDPRLAVAGLNPHSGEHGLFGAEEETEIAPAVEAARKEGYRVDGPRPADSVFYFALKGAWDAVLSLYHDQGHIAAKMVDFERTISLTLGLPFLRTSVDHGTAFDIAGTGKASGLSMVEAIRLAAVYVPAFRKKKEADARLFYGKHSRHDLQE